MQSWRTQFQFMKKLVIYHKSDFDGIFCREIAKHFLGEKDVTYVGWEYGESDEIVPPGVETIFMLDISVERWMNDPRLVWIDHHKSAMEKYPSVTNGWRIDGVAACRLAWQWFVMLQGGHDDPDIRVTIKGRDFVNFSLPSKRDFIDRRVEEPWAVRLAGEYDIWDKRDPDAELFQHGLRSEELYSTVWDNLLDLDGDATVTRLLNQGRALQYAKFKENEEIINNFGHDVELAGMRFLACNHARFNSLLFSACVKSRHEGLLGFKWTGKDWSVSLYHAPGKEHHDLSLIAAKYGGGGHKGACGFRCIDWPWKIL